MIMCSYFSAQGILHDMVRQKMLDIVISRMSYLFANVEDMLKMGRPPDPLYVGGQGCQAGSAFFNKSGGPNYGGSGDSGGRNSLQSVLRDGHAGGLYGIINLLVEERLRPGGANAAGSGSRGESNV